jgi:hypothetical protein
MCSGDCFRALIGRRIFRQRRDGHYELTPLAETLRTDAPVSLAGFSRVVGPPVVAGAPALLREQQVDDRVRVVEGSFFDSAPEGGDAYVLKNVIHDWPHDDAVRILANVRAAAQPGARVLLIEIVLPEHNRDFMGNWLDMEMLIVTAARERTAAEYGGLLARAGFHMNRVVQTASPISVVEATAT